VQACHCIFLWGCSPQFVVDIMVRPYCFNTVVVAVSDMVRNTGFPFYAISGTAWGGVRLEDQVTGDYGNNSFRYVGWR